jgi:sterol 3beta-glucosyltransferase
LRYQSKPVDIENPPWDPFTASTRVLLSTLTTFTTGFTDVLSAPVKGVQNANQQDSGKEMAKSVGKGFGKMTMALPKATLVDFPLALTEGLHQAPKLYGEEVRDHGKVTDMKSAGIVAGKVSAFVPIIFFLPYLKTRQEHED